MEHSPTFYNPSGDTLVGENRLPHWDQRAATYFVTFRLADSIPSHLLKRQAEEKAVWTSIHPKPWSEELEQEYHLRFSGEVERWLDQGSGICLLRYPAHAEIIREALHFHDGIRHRLHAWVVMPNHVHTIVETIGDHRLADLLKSWKGFTAKQINEITGRAGSLWQKSYYDRLIRGWEHFGNCVRYIRRNPKKAHLSDGEYLIGESGLAARF